MQEEVDQKTIALSMKTGKLTAQVLQAALKKYLQHRAKGKTTLHHGQQSLKQLIAIFKNKANSRRNGTSLSSQKAKLSEKHIVSRSEEHPGSVP